MNHYPKRQAYIIQIIGNGVKDYDYLNKFIRSLVKDLFGLNPCFVKRKNENTISIIIRSKVIFNFLNELEFPSGKKEEIVPPKWVIEKDLFFRRFIRGLFDTDGYLCSKYINRKYPIIGITSKSKSLLTVVQNFLDKEGITSYLGSHINKGEEFAISKIQISGWKNANSFFELIGKNNPRNMKKFDELGVNGNGGNRTPG